MYYKTASLKAVLAVPFALQLKAIKAVPFALQVD
jgi:hypothetical protein